MATATNREPGANPALPVLERGVQDLLYTAADAIIAIIAINEA